MVILLLFLRLSPSSFLQFSSPSSSPILSSPPFIPSPSLFPSVPWRQHYQRSASGKLQPESLLELEIGAVQGLEVIVGKGELVLHTDHCISFFLSFFCPTCDSLILIFFIFWSSTCILPCMEMWAYLSCSTFPALIVSRWRDVVSRMTSGVRLDFLTLRGACNYCCMGLGHMRALTGSTKLHGPKLPDQILVMFSR